jgi:ribonuclease D
LDTRPAAPPDDRPVRYVSTVDELVAVCEALRRSEVVALDTEFIRERTYYPQLCLVQLADAHQLVVVDALALQEESSDLAPLDALLADTSVLKVLHAARQDLEIFALRMGAVPAPVFDTQVAASLLGHGEQAGYAAVVHKLLGVALDKSHVRTDWAARPIPRDALAYAVDDVRYLLEVHRRLHDELAARGRLEWLDAEFAELARLDTYKVEPADAWRKVRGIQRLTAPQRARVVALAAWRERVAIESDKPRGWILKDEVLVDLARRNPADEAGLAAIRDMPPQVVKRRAADLLAALGAGGAAPEPEAPRVRLTPEQESLVDALAALTRLRATAQGVAAANLAPRRELERLVQGERELEVLSGWKREAVGTALLALLEGRIALAVVDGVLVEVAR